MRSRTATSIPVPPLTKRLPSCRYAVSLPSRERISNIYQLRAALAGLALRSFFKGAEDATPPGHGAETSGLRKNASNLCSFFHALDQARFQ